MGRQCCTSFGNFCCVGSTFIFSVLIDYIETDVKHLVVHAQSFLFSMLASSSMGTNNLQVLKPQL
jgi:hypothetical protein